MSRLRLFLLAFVLFIPSAQLAAKGNTNYVYRLAIAAIFQNDATYLSEWIEFHHMMGVDHFWLYSNHSSDNYKEVLAPYIRDGLVELIEWNQVGDWREFSFHIQPRAYRDALKRANTREQRTKWLAIIDSDEFLFSPLGCDLFSCLEQYYSDCSGVCVNWQLYGTSNVAKIPDDGVMTEQLTYKAPENHQRNLYFKSIVRPNRVKWCGNPHFCEYLPGYFHVNTNLQKFKMKNPGIFIDKLRINHYWTRDEEYMYSVKVPRYENWTNNKSVVTEAVRELNQVYDPILTRYAQELKMRIQMRRQPKNGIASNRQRGTHPTGAPLTLGIELSSTPID